MLRAGGPRWVLRRAPAERNGSIRHYLDPEHERPNPANRAYS